MFSSYSSTKIDELRSLYDEGFLNSSNLYRYLENLNKLNREAWVKQQRKEKHVWGIPFKTEAALRAQYNRSFKDWKVFKKEAFHTSFNCLSPQDQYDFEQIDALLSGVMVCRHVCELNEFTGGNPVQIDIKDMKSIQYVLRRKEMLAEYQFDFKV